MSSSPLPQFVSRSVQLTGRSGRFLDLVSGIRRPFELRIDEGGIAVDGPRGESASWLEIADVHVLIDGVRRYLVFPLTREAAHARGRTRGMWREPALLWAPQPGVMLSVLDADEIEVLDAVRRFSGARFPSPERVFGGGERRSTRLP